MQNSKLSIVFDEWTSCASKRYVNIVLLGDNKFWNLGLARIIGSATADHCLNLVKTHLLLFDVHFNNDIVCIQTDGCSVMTCIGDSIKPIIQQLCFAHAIQFAVLDVLYRAQPASVNPNYQDVPRDELQDDESDEEGDSTIVFEQDESILLNTQYLYLVKKVRSIVALFRKSPLKNDTLQKYSKTQFGKEFKLIIDCKTRWNSLCFMLDRFFLLKNCILKAKIDLGLKLDLNEADFRQIKQPFDVLKPVQTTVEMLCRRDTDLIVADVVLGTLLDHLDAQQSDVSHLLYLSLITEIKKRRTFATDLLKYLRSGNMASPIHKHLDISILVARQILKMLICVVKRVEPDELSIAIDEDEDFEEENESPSKKSKTSDDFLSLVKKAVNECKEDKPTEREVANGLVDELKTEIQLFETSGWKQKGTYLNFAYSSLRSITPTSVESERAFSSAGYLCNKIRSRLSDKNLSTLLFLRSYFQIKNEKT